MVPRVIAGTAGTTSSFTLLRIDTSGWTPFVELDCEKHRARVCLFERTDAPALTCQTGDDVSCATSGSVVVSQCPTTETKIASLRVTLDVQLGSLHLTATARPAL
jgi:hypothetical protein